MSDPRTPTYEQLSALCAQMAAALEGIRTDHANNVYQMGEGRVRRALCDVYDIAGKALTAYRTLSPDPINMVLRCPNCGKQHVDEPDERTPDWQNPPHRSHLCHGCGHIWRPADVPTNGVAAVKTVGKADSPKVSPDPQWQRVPDGYAVMPLIPTDEMCEVVNHNYGHESAYQIWRKMAEEFNRARGEG